MTQANQFASQWTDERIAEITKLWAEGYSATRIGAAMGISRSCVIGKVTRLGLPEPAEKLPVVTDRVYTRQLAEVTRAKVNAYYRQYSKKRREERKLMMETKASIREAMLDRGATKTSAAYRKHLPPMPDMSKGQLRAMLAQAAQNTAAL